MDRQPTKLKWAVHLQLVLHARSRPRAWHLHQAGDLPRFTERAFWTATSGRQGAVLLNVPMDLFSRQVPRRLAASYPLVRDSVPPGLPGPVAGVPNDYRYQMTHDLRDGKCSFPMPQ
jgi:hypothetical protein